MKRMWGVALLVWGSAFGWADAGETLAMTVSYDNGDPGEEPIVWTQEYWVDGEGRLVRWRQGEAETVFHWSADGVTWAPSRALPAGSLSFRDLVASRGPAGEIRWTDGGEEFSWSLSSGYQEWTSVEGKPHQVYTTEGSRLSKWFHDREEERWFLDRSPKVLRVLFGAVFLDANGWAATGECRVEGPGLWNPDPRIVLIHALILHRTLAIPLWPALLFEREYLR